MFSILLNIVDWKHQKVKENCLKLFFFKIVSHDFGAHDSSWLLEVVFIPFQGNHGKARSSELP